MLNTIPYNTFPASSKQFHKGDNEQLEHEISLLKSGKQNISDNTLTTTDKTIVGSINELNFNKSENAIIASAFNSETSYNVGDYCIYENKFYIFVSSHSGEWDNADVTEIKVSEELATLKSGLTNVTTQIKGLNSVWKMTQNSAGDVTFTTEDNRFTGFLLITGNTGKYAIYTVNVSLAGGQHILKLVGDDHNIAYSSGTLTVSLSASWSKATLVTDTVFS